MAELDNDLKESLRYDTSIDVLSWMRKDAIRRRDKATSEEEQKKCAEEILLYDGEENILNSSSSSDEAKTSVYDKIQRFYFPLIKKLFEERKLKNARRMEELENERARLKREIERCKVDLSKDYRREIRNFYVDADGDLIWVKPNGSTYDIEASKLKEPDWIAHMFCKMDYTLFGEFVGAYLKTLEQKGVKTLKIDICDFDVTQKFVIDENRENPV